LEGVIGKAGAKKVVNYFLKENTTPSVEWPFTDNSAVKYRFLPHNIRPVRRF
jgi:hypothetical protein